MCSYCPSLSIFIEISRNKVVVAEAVTIFTALDALNLEFKEWKDRYN